MALLVPVAILGVEVQLARTAPQLDDEVGERPVDQVLRTGPDPLRVVWLGDSTTTGVGAQPFTASMAARVAVGLTPGPVTLTVLGVSGAQVKAVTEEQVPDLASAQPDVVLVSIGANNVTHLSSQSTFRRQYRAMLDGIVAAAPQATIFVVGIPDMGTAPRLAVPLRQIAGVRARQLDDLIVEAASDAGVAYIDLAGPTSKIFSSDPDRYFSADKFHPSAEGHGVWAEAVLDGVEAQGGVGG